MAEEKTVITDSCVLTSYGLGVDKVWKGVLSNNSAISVNRRFSTDNLKSQYAALVSEIDCSSEKSLVMQMLESFEKQNKIQLPEDTFLILATTTGEIDLLERGVFNKNETDIYNSDLNNLLDKACNLFRTEKGMLVSAACASSTSAVISAANLIRSGRKDCVLVVGCDCVSEFLCSGFSALQAIDENPAKPFDKERNGLTVGEGAGCILLMSETRALESRNKIEGYVTGWGMTNDANHMTGPSRDGSGLAAAIKKALNTASVSPSRIGSVSAHGTGTVYNDLMEMKAFRKVFNNPVPAYSVKGALGHTMGASGLIEVVLTLETLKHHIIPPTVNLNNPIEEAAGWVKNETQLCDSEYSLSVNAGFGGVNTAILIQNA